MKEREAAGLESARFQSVLDELAIKIQGIGRICRL
jgi:hypothetical protein